RAVEGRPHHFDLANAGGLGVLLEQLVVLHDVELQVAHGELAGKADLGDLGRRRGGEHAGYHPDFNAWASDQLLGQAWPRSRVRSGVNAWGARAWLGVAVLGSR